MAGLGTKIKEALTPGHKHRSVGEVAGGHDSYTTESAYDTGAPVIGSNTATNRAVGGGEMLNTTNNTYSANEGVAGVGGVGHHTRTAVAGDNSVCETRTFTEVEDRPIMRERVERIVEHRPVEKQFVVETRPVGERELAEGVHYESAGVREYEVDRVEGTKCPTTTTGAGATNMGNRML